MDSYNTVRCEVRKGLSRAVTDHCLLDQSIAKRRRYMSIKDVWLENDCDRWV